MHDLFQRLKRRHEFWLASVIAVLVVYLSIATQGFLTLQNLFDRFTALGNALVRNLRIEPSTHFGARTVAGQIA